MKSKYITLFLIVLGSLSPTAQNLTLNNYKYVIVPARYTFLEQEDKYQLNSLSKFLFEKYGFQAFLDTEQLPQDALANRCLVLRSNVIENRTLFKTKLTVELRNCRGEIVFTSKTGETREKDYKKAYHLALRDAFSSFDNINYTFEPSQEYNTEETTTKANEQTRQEMQETAPIAQETKSEKPTETKETTTLREADDILYAQPVKNGYQLVDKTPKVVYRIKKTGDSNIFIVEGIEGILSQKETNWILEYYKGEILVQEILNIKF